MPRIPKQVTLTNASVDVLNTIRANASVDYRNYVPLATADSDSIRAIGNVIMDFPALQNEFLTSLINRIARVLVTSKLYDNPWSFFKKGIIEYGEIVEDVFVELAKPQPYDVEISESELFKREIPDVRSAFYVLNYKTFYKNTIQRRELERAFLSWDGVDELISKIISSMYSAANYDEFCVMQYMLARQILDGKFPVVTIPTVEAVNMKQIVSNVKSTSNDLTFMSDKYNIAGVRNYTDKRNQYIIMSSIFDATVDVEVLASAFNMDKADFYGNRVLVNSFGALDTARLAEIFKGNPNYEEIGEDELEELNNIACVLVDENFFMIFDNLIDFKELENQQGLYWNYFLHNWKTFACSPFANRVCFNSVTPSITSVTVTPATANVSVGDKLKLSASVVASGFAPTSVTWTSNSEYATVDAGGNVVILTGATGEIVITATSTFDSTKKGTSTLTVA